eukprot:2022973-Rhodomonas_salina.2
MALKVSCLDHGFNEDHSNCSRLLSPVSDFFNSVDNPPFRILLSFRRSGRVYTWIDSASQGHVVAVEAGVRQRTGCKLKLQGMTGDTSFDCPYR